MRRQPQTRIGEWYANLSPLNQALLQFFIAIAGVLFLAWGRTNNYF